MPGSVPEPKRANPTGLPVPLKPLAASAAPIRMDTTSERYSRATIVLVALNVGVWLLQLAAGVSPFGAASPTLVAWGGNLPVFTLTGDTWRLFTSIFVHGNALHLLLNMLALRMTADRTDDEFGAARMLVIYVAGGILASCASVLWAERHASLATPTALLTVSVGASGAVMAQFGALLVALVITPPRFVPLAVDKRPGVDAGLIVIVALNVGAGFFFPHVDQAAHIGGLLGGMAVGTLMAVFPNATGGRAALARHVAAALLVTACVGALLHFAPHDKLVLMRAIWGSRLVPPR